MDLSKICIVLCRPEESRNIIKAFLEEANLVIITAGMGKGTGRAKAALSPSAQPGASAPSRRSAGPSSPGPRPAWRPARHRRRPESGRPARRRFSRR